MAKLPSTHTQLLRQRQFEAALIEDNARTLLEKCFERASEALPLFTITRDRLNQQLNDLWTTRRAIAGLESEAENVA